MLDTINRTLVLCTGMAVLDLESTLDEFGWTHCEALKESSNGSGTKDGTQSGLRIIAVQVAKDSAVRPKDNSAVEDCADKGRGEAFEEATGAFMLKLQRRK